MNVYASSHHPVLFKEIQGLVREARYPPEFELRVTHDMYACCQSYVALRPALDTTTTNRPLLTLTGTIPINYKSNTYQIPVLIMCPPEYPNMAPVPYVRPTQSMLLRENHSHVDRTGRVFLPHYLGVWNKNHCNIYGVVVMMVRVFSVSPPVNARPATLRYSDPQRKALLMQLSTRLKERLLRENEETMSKLCLLLDKQNTMAEHRNDVTSFYRTKSQRKTDIRTRHKDLTAEKEELTNFLQSVDYDYDETESADAKPLDSLLQCRTILDQQIIQCNATDLAITDALHQVDEAFVNGLIHLAVYIKEVRKLAREQFFPRALRMKVELEQANSKENGDSGMRKMKSVRGAPLYAS